MQLHLTDHEDDLNALLFLKHLFPPKWLDLINYENNFVWILSKFHPHSFFHKGKKIKKCSSHLI